MKVLTSGTITIVDLSDPIISSTEPPETVEDMLWLDIGHTPPILKIFKNGKWQIVGDNSGIVGDLEELKKLYDKVISDLEKVDKELGDLETLSLLEIDNTKDILIEYSNHLTTTSGISPTIINNVRLLKNEGYFNSCLRVARENSSINYPKGSISKDADFTINMWIKPNTMVGTVDYDYKVFQMGASQNTSILTIRGYRPTAEEPSNRRLVAEFGSNNGNRQYKDLIHAKLFTLTEWEMFTVVYTHSNRRFEFYRNGEHWTSYSPAIIHPVEFIGMSNSGWDYDNVVVLQKALSNVEILAIHKHSRPFRDPNIKTPVAPNPTPGSFDIEGATVRTQGTVAKNLKYKPV